MFGPRESLQAARDVTLGLGPVDGPPGPPAAANAATCVGVHESRHMKLGLGLWRVVVARGLAGSETVAAAVPLRVSRVGLKENAYGECAYD